MTSLRHLAPVRAVLRARYRRRFATPAGQGALCGAYASFAEAARHAPPALARGYDTPDAAAM